MSAPTLTPQQAPLDGGAVAPRGRRRRHVGLPLQLAFIGYPVVWGTGLGLLMFPLAGLTAIVGLLRRGGSRTPLPLAMTVWFAFLAWTTTGLLVLRAPDRLVAWGYRTSMYVTAAAFLVWILRASRESLSDRTVLRIVAGLWLATAIGGLLSTVTPGLEITTPVERLLPASLLDIGLIRNSVHLQIADVSRILGFTVGRPEAPYAFTNEWGGNLALLTPLLMATWSLDATRRWRRTTMLLAGLTVVPLVFSLNRGAWLSLAVGLLYVAARRAPAVSRATLVKVGAAGIAGIVLVLASPLGSVIEARTETGHSDDGRARLYSQAIDLTVESPVVGWGAPQPNQLKPDGASVGTHGQLWLLLVSHGLPGAVLYGLFFALAYLAALRWRARHAVWLEATLVVALVQFPIYELLPAPMLTLAVVAGLALRGYRDQQARFER